MKYTLKDICTKIGSGATPTGGKEAYKGGDYALVRSQNVLDYTFTTSGLAYINETQAKKLDGVKVEVGDVLLNITGDSVARACIIPDEILPARVNQHVAIIRANNQYALNEYLLYFLQYNKQYLLSISQGGGTRSAITKKMIEDIEIDLPSLEDQLSIVNIINSISKKIEVNQQINDNLEQQAQALYKSWFVDFEPFCGGEFIESSLGSIPVGWKVGQLSDICEIVGGGTPSKSHPEYYCKRGIAWITPKDLSVSKSKFSSRGSEDITSDGYKNSSAKLMPRGTVLFSSRAPIGYISIATNRICTNQGFKSAVPGTAGTGYLYYFLQANTDKIESKASGSTFKEASGSLMKSLEVIIPADGIFNQFEAELAPILNKQENIASEIQTLTTLRDTLLPKLMSGELKINEIDC